MFKPFIYDCDRSIEVRRLTVGHIEATGLAEQIEMLGWAYNDIGSVVPQTRESLGSGHIFPWVESWDELQVSFNLCLFGFYKQAMISLRTGLEVGLLSVYWNLDDDGHVVISEWLKSDDETPRLAGIWKRLEKHSNFQTFQAQYDIKARLLSLSFLHDYVHTRGIKYSNRMGTAWKPNFQTFEVHCFKTWFDAFRDVIEVLTILHLVKYPLGATKYDYPTKFGVDLPMFGGLDSFKIERIEKVIGKDAFDALEDVARKDKYVQGTLRYVQNLPDMTDMDLQSQITNMDKMMIRQMGFEKWLDQERMLMGDAFAKGANHKQRIEYLMEWAKENGFEKPAWEKHNGE